MEPVFSIADIWPCVNIYEVLSFWYNVEMISKEEVQHIAKLARLKLEEGEIEKMQKEMTAILGYFDLLQKADTRAVKKPAAFAKASASQARKDVVRKDNEAGDLINAAPDQVDGYIKVKQVL